MNGPIWRGRKFTTAMTFFRTSVSGLYCSVIWAEDLRVPISGPKSITSLIAGLRASGKGAASTTVPPDVDLHEIIKLAGGVADSSLMSSPQSETGYWRRLPGPFSTGPGLRDHKIRRHAIFTVRRRRPSRTRNVRPHSSAVARRLSISFRSSTGRGCRRYARHAPPPCNAGHTAHARLAAKSGEVVSRHPQKHACRLKRDSTDADPNRITPRRRFKLDHLRPVGA